MENYQNEIHEIEIKFELTDSQAFSLSDYLTEQLNKDCIDDFYTYMAVRRLLDKLDDVLNS